MAPLPSGLSLFIHLGIILVAWLLGLLGISRMRTKEVLEDPSLYSVSKMASARVLSVLILLTAATLMIMFLYVALQTGFRQGASEPHRIFLEDLSQNLQEITTTVPALLEYHAEYQKPSPAYQGPAIASR